MLEVNRLGDEGATESLTPVLLVDGSKVLATPDQLEKTSVAIKILEDTRGPKINGFTYKNSTTYRRRYGHRQKYHMVEITSISAS